MMIHWKFGNQVGVLDIGQAGQLKESLAQELALDSSSFYLTQNGKILWNNNNFSLFPDPDAQVPVCIVPRLCGGKGGFGSMLRAIGAQIEKTTNRDACRDLSGRRLRDINEEQRLKRWFAKQKEREAESAERKKKKLEKLRQICEGPPLPKMEDKEYNEQRANMAESVFEAVEKGLETSGSTSKATEDPSQSDSSSSSSKDEVPSSSSDGKQLDAQKQEVKETNAASGSSTSNPAKNTKLKKTMWDEDLDSDVSSDSEDEVPAKKAKAN